MLHPPPKQNKKTFLTNLPLTTTLFHYCIFLCLLKEVRVHEGVTNSYLWLADTFQCQLALQLTISGSYLDTLARARLALLKCSGSRASDTSQVLLLHLCPRTQYEQLFPFSVLLDNYYGAFKCLAPDLCQSMQPCEYCDSGDNWSCCLSPVRYSIDPMVHKLYFFNLYKPTFKHTRS